MYSILIIAAMIVAGAQAQGICTGLSIADCTSSSHSGCSWLPSRNECVEQCNYLNQEECTASPACNYNLGQCSYYTATCSERMVYACIFNCGIEVGQNICRDCSSAATKTNCGRISNCEWDGQTCGASGRECYSISNPNQCTETGCSWSDGYCSLPSIKRDGLCTTSDTTNCIRYKNDLVPCSELTTQISCAWQGTCNWNTFSQSCVDTDFCDDLSDQDQALCEPAGCTPVGPGCTKATAFTKCASIFDKYTCNKQKTCAFNTNGASTCQPVVGCKGLPESICTEKPDCRWGSSSNTCVNSGRPCGEIRMLCGGEKCKNMVRDPDMTEYSLFGSFHDRQLLISMSGASVLKNDIPCFGCPLCQPGYVWNIGATIQCGADGIGSLGQQLCVLPGDYSDGTGTPDKPDFPVTGVPTLAPVSTGVPTGVPSAPHSTGTPVKPDVPVTGVPTLAPGSTGAPHTPERTGAPSAPSHGTGSPDGGNNGTVAPATPDGDGDNGDNKIIIIIVAGSVLLLVIVLVSLAFKFCNKNNIKRENHFPGSNDGYTHELCE